MVNALSKEDAVEMEKNVLRLCDTNRDNCIDFTEFMTTLHIIALVAEQKTSCLKRFSVCLMKMLTGQYLWRK